MRSEPPKLSKDPMYQLLRVDNVKAFNIKKEAGQSCDLRGVDLRGVDFSRACLLGVNIRGARISGTFFPARLTAEEIRLSVDLGTRMRYNPLCDDD